MDDSLVKKIKESPFYREFQEHLINSASKLDTVTGMENLSNTAAGELCRARGLALEILEVILHPFVNIKEKNEPSEDDVMKRKKKFGLS